MGVENGLNADHKKNTNTQINVKKKEKKIPKKITKINYQNKLPKKISNIKLIIRGLQICLQSQNLQKF
jgi:hypothetical protein